MSGFTVIDLETTGFAYRHTDRVCEIGVVLRWHARRARDQRPKAGILGP